MRLTVILAALCAVLFAAPAEARPKHTSPYGGEVGCDLMRPCYGNGRPIYSEVTGQMGKLAQGRRHDVNPGQKAPSEYRQRNNFSHLSATSSGRREISPGPGLSRVMAEGAGRAVNWIKPRAWCGWQMRVWLGVANPAGNLARWWAGYGRDAHGPHVGAIVVWPRGRRHGHVGIITGRTADGRWIVKSGNDGHRVRERPRSVAGAIAFRWPV
jgi:hypothetical protein